MAKIFISYTGQDRAWAHWIGVTLRDNGHEPFVHDWEIGAGQSIKQWMEERIIDADHVLVVVSNAYAKAGFSKAERWNSFWRDRNGSDGFLVPVEVETVTDWPPLAKPLNRLSLVGKTEAEAEKALLEFLKPPATRPPFPGTGGSSPTVVGKLQIVEPADSALFIGYSEPLPTLRPVLPSAEGQAGASGGAGRSKPPGNARSEADDVPDPRNSSAFQEWLRSKPRDWAVVIASRAALRVLPAVRWRPLSTEDASRLILPIFHAAAVSRFAAAYPNRNSILYMGAAEDAADAATYANAHAADAATAAAHAANLAAVTTYAADAAAFAAEATTYAANAAAAAAYDYDEHDDEAVTAAVAAVTAATRRELSVLRDGTPSAQVACMPLWKNEGAAGITRELWQALARDMRVLDSSWEIWIDWYQDVLGGVSHRPPHDEEIDEAYTDLPGRLPWKGGPVAVNFEIKARLDALRADELSAEMPEQTPAPVRVEERDGKVAKVIDRDSPLQTSEHDFNAWREPVVEHIAELTSSDFAQGTNHSRVRDRLISLGGLLPGGVAEVKDRQFRIGYEIERFERLIAAYRSGGDDMPALNAASLEDLDALRIALTMGVDKLERWAEFRRLASVDPKREGEADREAVAEAMDDMATDMERNPAYFDPELPASFRFLAEAVRDPVGATTTIVYGAVKSVENLMSFLGQRALGLGRKVLDEAEKPIPKAVAASLLAGLGGAALRLSGALPEGWAWLKPLLESIARSAGM